MILSIDWDWFIPTVDAFDLGHHESEFFLNALWHTRGYLIDQMKTSGQEVDFWSNMRKIVDLQTTEIKVSESHLSAFRLVETSNEHLILVDAHHDCWPFDARNKRVDCANWVAAWIKLGRHALGIERCVIWVVPSKEYIKMFQGTIQRGVRNNLMIITMEQLPGVLSKIEPEISVVHACRSGCWVPPWLDKEWLAFLKASGLEIKPMDPEPWDGIRERWGENDLQCAIALDKRFRDARESISLQPFQEKVS